MAMVPAAAAGADSLASYLALADFAMAHRQEIGQGLKRVGNAARSKFKSKKQSKRAKLNHSKKSKIADPVASIPAKRAQIIEEHSIFKNTRKLYGQKLIEVDFGDNINQRQRNIINVSGLKICCELKNLTNDPLYVNFAILSPKAGVDPSQDIDTTDFFRASDSNDRSKDFSTQLTSTEMHCLPINADKYTVLKHQRTTLVAAATGGDTVSLTGKSYMNLDWWIPMKRQFRFDGTVGTPDNGQVYFVYWFDRYMTTTLVAETVNGVKFSNKTIMYYHEPMNGCCH